MINILMNQNPGLTDWVSDPWAPNNLLTPEQKKNTSWTPVGQATDKKLRPQPTKMNSFIAEAVQTSTHNLCFGAKIRK